MNEKAEVSLGTFFHTMTNRVCIHIVILHQDTGDDSFLSTVDKQLASQLVCFMQICESVDASN